MKVIVNGEVMEVAEGISVQQLLDQCQIKPVRVAVERNRQIVVRKSFAITPLAPDDRIEIVTFVGGG